MGLRFQRRVTLIPGVRLNFSMSGVSASIGPRGAGLNFSSRGTTGHVGLPGTGISFRSGLSSSGSRSAAARWERQQAKEAERLVAIKQHDAYQRVLATFGSILSHRATEPVDWDQEYASQGPFEFPDFRPSFSEPTATSARASVSSANPLAPWFVLVGSGAVGVALAPQVWIQVLIALPTLYFGSQIVRILQRKGSASEELLPRQRDQYRRALAESQATYDAEKETAKVAYQGEEKLRERLRGIVASGDVELAASLLEVELSNEDMPVPIHFDVHFEGITQVSLSITLPPLSEMPEHDTRLTKTGKLSEKALSIRDRATFHRRVCSGLALRLIHETYRVLPFVTAVSATGFVERPIHPVGEPPYLALRVNTVRESWSRYDLDGAEPHAILLAMGGELSSSRDGTLKPISVGE